MTEPETFDPLCPQCGQNLREAGVSSGVVSSGSNNIEVLACGACSKVFAAFPGPLIPSAEETR
jgi:hypothetical protein